MQPSVSADGQTIVYASDRGDSPYLQLWIRTLPDGEPRRLTSGTADSYQPSISPDGHTVAYRSDAKGGGIFLQKVQGGTPKLVAQGGHHPRYSPGGQRITFLKDPGRLFVMDAASGLSQPFRTQFASISDAIWSPDNNTLLISGCLTNDAASCDWFITSSEATDPPINIHTADLFKQAHVGGQATPNLWLPDSNRIVFTVVSPATGAARLWTIQVAPNPWHVDGRPERFVTGETDQRWPTASAKGPVVYTSRTENVDLYVKPIDSNHARSKGALTRVTNDPSIDQRPSISENGKRIAWETSRGGNFEVWVKDLDKNEEHAITSGPLREHMPAICRDGSKLVYDAHDGDKVTVFLSDFAGGSPTMVVEENVGQGSFQFTPKADAVLYFHRAPPGTVGLLDLSTKQRTPLLQHPKLNLSLADARLSPDAKWIVFTVPVGPHKSRLAVAPVTKEVQSDDKLWTYLHPQTYNAYQPEWSPDGRFLYYLSDMSGKLAIFAMPMNEKKQPAGSPRPIHEFRSRRLTINEMRPRDIGLAVAKDKLALGVASYSGTLWSVAP